MAMPLAATILRSISQPVNKARTCRQQSMQVNFLEKDTAGTAPAYARYSNSDYSLVDFATCNVTQFKSKKQHPQTCDSCCAGPTAGHVTVAEEQLQIINAQVLQLSLSAPGTALRSCCRQARSQRHTSELPLVCAQASCTAGFAQVALTLTWMSCSHLNDRKMAGQSYRRLWCRLLCRQLARLHCATAW
jgi:hypothetical protein